MIEVLNFLKEIFSNFQEVKTRQDSVPNPYDLVTEDGAIFTKTAFRQGIHYNILANWGTKNLKVHLGSTLGKSAILSPVAQWTRKVGIVT